MASQPSEHATRLVEALLRLAGTVERASHRHPRQPMLLCRQLVELGRGVYGLDLHDAAAVDRLVTATDGVRLSFEAYCSSDDGRAA